MDDNSNLMIPVADTTEPDPLLQLQHNYLLNKALEKAAEEETELQKERLLRERDDLKAEIALLVQENRMREESIRSKKERIELCKQMIQSLDQVRKEQIRAERELQSAVLNQRTKLAEKRDDERDFHKYITTDRPAELLEQVRKMKSELAHQMEENERKREIRRLKKTQQRSDNWSTKVTGADSESTGRVEDADDELNIQMDEQRVGMIWSELNNSLMPSLD